MCPPTGLEAGVTTKSCACLRLLVSHTASINQVSAQTWGSKRNCERHWGPTGQDADGNEAAMKEGS